MHKIFCMRPAMKKRYLTYAGIVAAMVLVGIFIAICLSSFPFPFLPPSASIDPVTRASVDENNMLILTGTTTLPWYANMSVSITACPSHGDCTGGIKEWNQATIIPAADGGRNRWMGEFDLSQLAPGDYLITVGTYSFGENYSPIENPPLLTGHFTLGDDNAGPGAIHTRSPAVRPFIRINPVDLAGSTLKITGITSLPSATPLAWDLYTITSASADNSVGNNGTTLVTEGTEGVNRWAVKIDNVSSGQYKVTITGNPAGTTSPAGMVSATLDFGVPPALSRNTTGITPGSPFIAIDTLPDIHTEGVYIISGTTSLPSGQDLMVNVYPAAFETGTYNFSVDASIAGPDTTFSDTGIFSGAAGGTEVVDGTGGENLWSFKLETYKFSPGEYVVNVSNDDFDFATMTLKYGDLFSSRTFTITETSS
jgi:hypothetical protein